MTQKISKWVIFMRAFVVSLLALQPVKMGHAQSSEDSAWQSATDRNTEQAYHDYLSAYPAGAYVRDAIVALQRLGEIRGGSPTRDIGTSGRSSGSGSQSGSGGSGDLY